MSDSRLEKFIYAICSMDVTDLPVPLSRIEKLWNCLIIGETPDFEPLSRNEKYLMAMLDRYDISNLPAPMSRGEKLLYKIAIGETDLSDVPGYLSRYEELLKYLIENGGISGGDFEYVLYTLNQSLSTLYATVEKPVKSAILTGQTLVNLVPKFKDSRWIKNGGGAPSLTKTDDYMILSPTNTGSSVIELRDVSMFKKDTVYTFIVNVLENTYSKVFLSDFSLNNNTQLQVGINKFTKIFNHTSPMIRIGYTGSIDAGSVLKIANIVVIEGDYTSKNIPYFEGMQSVKMPVLTTTGKNLTSLEICYDNFIKTVSGGNDTTFKDGVLTLKWTGAVRTATLVNNVFKPNTQYTLSYWCKSNVGSNWQRSMIRIKYTDGTESKLSSDSTSSTEFTQQILISRPNKTVDSIYVELNSVLYINQIQLEEGSTATPYEPYKSNILTVNEPVELRGIGDVQDTLDCLTGELTERIGEIVFDGSEDWKLHETNGYFWLTTRQELNAVNDKLISDKLISNGGNLNFPQIYVFNGIDTVDKFKAWLQENKPTMQFKLEVESIKTVDLTTVDRSISPSFPNC